MGLRTSSGQPLLLQTRQPYEVVWLTSRAVWLTTLPSLVVALALLYLVKSGFAFRLARDLRSGQDADRPRWPTAGRGAHPRGGVFGLWSNDPPDQDVEVLLHGVDRRVVGFPDPLQQRQATNTASTWASGTGTARWRAMPTRPSR